MQKTHLKENEAKLLGHVFKGTVYQAPSDIRAGGVMIGIADKNTRVVMRKNIDPVGRYIILKGKINSRQVVIVALHPSNQQQASFWETLQKSCSGIRQTL